MATFDPGKVIVQFGAIPVSGFADGSMVNVEPQGDGVTAVVGSAGETAFVESHDRRSLVTIRLMGTSPINALLSAWFQAGNIPAPLVISSLTTATIHASGEAKLQRNPGADYGADVPVREWIFVVPVMDHLG